MLGSGAWSWGMTWGRTVRRGMRPVFMHQRRKVWAGRRVAGFSVCHASMSACLHCPMARPRLASHARKAPAWVTSCLAWLLWERPSGPFSSVARSRRIWCQVAKCRRSRRCSGFSMVASRSVNAALVEKPVKSCVLRRGGVSQCSEDRAASRSEWVPWAALRASSGARCWPRSVVRTAWWFGGVGGGFVGWAMLQA